MSKSTLIGAIAVGVLAVGAVGYMIGNYAGAPTLSTHGEITDIDHKPRRKCGATKTSEGKTKPKWCSEEWQVEVSYQGTRDRRTSSVRPPRWQYEGAPVRVHYKVGRWDQARMVSRIERV